MKFDFEEAFRFALCALKLNRSHPEIRRDRKWLMQFIMMHGIFTSVFFVLLYNVIYVDVKNNNSAQACKNGVICVIYAISTFEYATLLSNQKHLQKLMEVMRSDYENARTMTPGEQEIMLEYVKSGNLVCKLWLFIGIYSSLAFILKHIFLMIHCYVTEEFKLLPPYDLTFPAVIEDVRGNVFVYIVIYLFLLFYLAYSAVMAIGFIPLGPIFIFHACGQLMVLKRKLVKLFHEIDDAEVEEKLKDIVKHLKCIYSFVHDIQESFRVAFELTLKSTTIIVPITIFEVIQSFHRGDVSVEFITFIFGSFLLGSAPCYYGDMLLEKGEEVRQALYMCGWERRYNRSMRSTLLLLLQRAHRPIAIRTMFRTVNLETLTDHFHQSYGLFNLMNAAWN